jgi:hypothetical protein
MLHRDPLVIIRDGCQLVDSDLKHSGSLVPAVSCLEKGEAVDLVGILSPYRQTEKEERPLVRIDSPLGRSHL